MGNLDITPTLKLFRASSCAYFVLLYLHIPYTLTKQAEEFLGTAAEFRVFHQVKVGFVPVEQAPPSIKDKT